MILYVIIIIIILVLIALTIWLLVRQNSPTKAGFGQSCANTSDCNSGLVCTNNVCKVAHGGVCSASSDCANGQVCLNGVCSVRLGGLNAACPCESGFTCVNNVCKAIVGQPCTNTSDCSSGMCENGVCMADLTMMTSSNNTNGNTMTARNWCHDNSSCDTRSRDTDSRSRDTDTSCDSKDTDSGSRRWSHSNSKECDTSDYSSVERNCSKQKCDATSNSTSMINSKTDCTSKSSFTEMITCTDTDCSGTKYSLSTSYSPSLSRRSSFSSPKCSRNNSTDSDSTNCSPKCNRKTECDTSNTNTDCDSPRTRKHHIKRGVYTTTASNQDETKFTNVEQPIIDVAKLGSNFLLLLENGNIISSPVTGLGATNATGTTLTTNRKMHRMVRFGNDIVAVDRKGRMFSQNRAAANTWIWEPLTNFPRDVLFITSTNNGSHLEVIAHCKNSTQAFLYRNSANWKNGVFEARRKTKEPRFYGQTINRYIDINEENNHGVTNDGVKYRHIKGAGFYSTGANGVTASPGEIVQLLTTDCFKHVVVIDNRAYFIFEQR